MRYDNTALLGSQVWGECMTTKSEEANSLPLGEPGIDPDAPFEQAFARLEQVVRALEGGDVALDESLRLFEEGVRLARLCSAKLDKAEGQMRKLVETAEGAVQEEPFEELPGAASS